jgi:hypothetical protein
MPAVIKIVAMHNLGGPRILRLQVKAFEGWKANGNIDWYESWVPKGKKRV